MGFRQIAHTHQLNRDHGRLWLRQREYLTPQHSTTCRMRGARGLKGFWIMSRVRFTVAGFAH